MNTAHVAGEIQAEITLPPSSQLGANRGIISS